ncbi:hypothetical protein FS749_003522 [Ceratobasidium sp. UAMH 11750]|nr:hypothetical protein FS749_003522 [Ceratobasidium sp. UAMH 11750]
MDIMSRNKTAVERALTRGLEYIKPDMSGLNNASPRAGLGLLTSGTVYNPSPLKPTEKRTITILLIGETGTGKTSFMSLLVNLFNGNGALELRDWHDHSNESGLDKSQSQTTKPTFYTMTTSDRMRLQILDTPGLADTRGVEQDNKHKAEINKAINKSVTSIDAVLIMANGTVERLTVATEYTLSVITSIFPRSIIDNIGFIFTNSEPLKWNFEMGSLQPELRASQYWLIQNPLAMLKKYEQMRRNQQLSKRHMEKQEHQLKMGYDDVVETLNEFLEWLDRRDPQPTKEINTLYQLSVGIEANISMALSAITRLSEQRVDYERRARELENTKLTKDGLEALIKAQTAPVWDRQLSERHNIICIASNCFKNCHVPCSLEFLTDPDELGRRCATFDPEPQPRGVSSRCSVCSHKAEEHRHYKHLHVRKPREMDPGSRKKLEEIVTAEERHAAAKDLIQRNMERINDEMALTRDRIRYLVEDYHQLSLTSNFAGHIRSAIKLLELKREELGSKPDTDSELKLIDESIDTFERKLKILAENKPPGWRTACNQGRVFGMSD